MPRGAAVERKRKRHAEAGKGLPPEPFRFRAVLPFEPRNVVAIRPHGAPLSRHMREKRIVGFEYFFEDEMPGPRVENQVMIRPYQLMRIRTKTEDRESHQRRHFEIEAEPSV